MKRDLTIADAERLQLLFHPLLAPGGAVIAFNPDDTLWIAQHDGSGAWSSRRPVATGLAIVNNQQYPVAAWSPEGRQLLFQAGCNVMAITGHPIGPDGLSMKGPQSVMSGGEDDGGSCGRPPEV